MREFVGPMHVPSWSKLGSAPLFEQLCMQASEDSESGAIRSIENN